MTPALCTDIVSRLTHTPPDPEVVTHLKTCSECAQTREVLLQLKSQETLLLTPPQTLRNRILSATAAQSVRPPPVLHLLRQRTALWATLAILFLVFTGSLFWRYFPSHSAPTFQISEDGGQFLVRDLSRAAIVTTAPTVIIAPDQSRFDLARATQATIQARGLTLVSGRARIRVTPGIDPFFTLTPHGRIEVLGTEFSCEVSLHRSDVEVFSGRILVHPASGTAFPLIAGQQGSMLYFPHKTHTNTGEENVVPDRPLATSNHLLPTTRYGTTTYSPEQE